MNIRKDNIRTNSKDKNIDGYHIPIMLSAVLNGLDIKSGEIIIDATVNRAGHSIEFAKLLDKKGTLIINDMDNIALQEAVINLKSNIKENSLPTIIPINDNFKNLKTNINTAGLLNILADKMFLDLGISSQELDISGRGFSFLRDEPLLMTFIDKITDDTITAEYIVNNWEEETIADILYNFSDEKYSRRIARAIIENRNILHKKGESIKTTFQLVDIIKSALPNRELYKHSHPATKTFQAIRMAVNNEIGNIIDLINDIDNLIKVNGRIAILTFHSVEDRIVKTKMKEKDNWIAINKKVITEDENNLQNNPRARSAKLRIYERIQ